jgi:hypothetical protein
MTAKRTIAWPVIAITIFLPIEDVNSCIAFLPFQDVILLDWDTDKFAEETKNAGGDRARTIWRQPPFLTSFDELF